MNNNFPKHWQIKKLEEICEKISAGGDKPDKFSTIKTNEFKTPIYSNGIKDNGLYGYTNLPTIDKKAVTISARGTIGFVCVRNEPFCPIVRLITAIPDNKMLNLIFLAYALKYKIPFGEGSSIPQLTLPNFRRIKIPLPPLDEQNLIVKKIESCFEKIDFAILNLKKSKELIEIYKQSVLSHAFNGKLTNSNLNSWQVKKLGEISLIKGGKRLPKGAKFSHDKTDYPYIRVVDFENMTIDVSNLKYISCEIQNKIKHYTILKNDIYISIAGTIGKSGCIPDCLDGANLTENAAKIVHKENKYFLAYFLNSLNGQQQIKNFTKATTQAKLALYRIGQIEIPLPNLQTQAQIVSQIEKRFKAADKALNLIEQNLKKAEILKQSILNKAFNGELVKDKNE